MAVDRGETLVIEVTTKDASTKELVDPTSVKITITRGASTLVDGEDMDYDSEGTYHYDFDTTFLGIHTIKVTGVRGDRTTITKDSFKVV